MSAPSIVDLTADAAKMKAAEDTIEGKEPEEDHLPDINRFVDWEEKYNHVVAELEKAQQNCAVETAKCTKRDGTIAELTGTIGRMKTVHNKFAMDHILFAKGAHELNRLRSVVQDLQNLHIPVKDFRSTEDLELILQFKPEPKRGAFKDPLKDLPKGIWGDLRIIRDTEDTPLLIAKTKSDDFYVAKAFSEYRTELAKYLSGHGQFTCTKCALPLHTKYNWCVCMRCMHVVYCSTRCLAEHKPAHLGCHLHRVWDASKPAPTEDTAKAPASSSSSSSSSGQDRSNKRQRESNEGYLPPRTAPPGRGNSKGKGKGKGQGKGKGRPSRPGPRLQGRQDRPSDNDCRTFLRSGACNDRNCIFDHNVANREDYIRMDINGRWAEGNFGSKEPVYVYENYQGRDASQDSYTVEEADDNHDVDQDDIN
jgi:hypothetical protein